MGYEVLVVVVGTQGKGQFITASVHDDYSTTTEQTVTTWTCADGSKEDIPQDKEGASRCGCGPMSAAGGVKPNKMLGTTTATNSSNMRMVSGHGPGCSGNSCSGGVVI